MRQVLQEEKVMTDTAQGKGRRKPPKTLEEGMDRIAKKIGVAVQEPLMYHGWYEFNVREALAHEKTYFGRTKLSAVKSACEGEGV